MSAPNEIAGTVGSIMVHKAVNVNMDDTLETVRELFHTHSFHHLLVVEGHKLVGVISDRDLLRHLSPFVGKPLGERSQDVATLHKRVHQVMTRRPITAGEQTTLGEAACLMLDQRISCLPVVDEAGRPVGIVTWRDLLKVLIGGQQPVVRAA